MRGIAKYLLVTMVAILASTSWAFALPELQLDVSNGVYDSSTETIVATTPTFKLYAILDSQMLSLSDTYYITAAIMPSDISAGSYGYFTFNGTTVNVTSDMQQGNPGYPIELPSHGIYPAYYKSFAFTFTPIQYAIPYDTSADPGGLKISTTPTDYKFAAFSVDVTNLDPSLSVHFDVWDETANKQGKYSVNIEPYSHDAQSPPGSNVPEPAAFLMTGASLLILGASKLRKRFL